MHIRSGKQNVGRHNRSGRRCAAREKRKTMSPSRGVRRRFLQLMISGSVFVLLVTVKVFLPGHMTAIHETLTQVLHENMDVRAVFSSVSQMVLGEESVQDLVQTVFGEKKLIQAAAPVSVTVEQDPTEALRTLKDFQTVRQQEPPANLEEGLASMAYIQYSEENLPEHVSLEQQMLGVEYRTPLQGTLTSGFGYREHPVGGEQSFHYGIDLAANTGTDIVCFADGIVTVVGESNSYGKYCLVDHGNGVETLYAHCSKITVSSGTKLSRGKKLGEVGESGIATGPHLHFEIHKDGVYLNPIYYVEV